MATETDPEDATAALKVFGTTELLEQILLELPMRSLLPTMRVSRSWAATVTGSSKIQKALFLQPCIRDLGDEEFSFPKAAGDALYLTVAEFFNQSLKAPPTYVLNPWMKIIFVISKYSFLYDRERHHFSSTAGCWRSMLLTQPPVRSVSIPLHKRLIKRRHKVFDVMCSSETGVTTGDIAGQMARFRERVVASVEYFGNVDEGLIPAFGIEKVPVKTE